jgi:uncharacterized protein YdaU (DUF1376 family)
MAALPYMQLYVADYLADTAHLTTEEHGAYLLLLFSYWQTGKPLRADRLASVSRLSNERWTNVEQTLKDFFHVKSGYWTHFRVESDLEKVASKSKKNSEAGKNSAKARALIKQALEEDESTNVETNVEETLQRNVNHTDTDTDTDTKHIDQKPRVQKPKSPKTAKTKSDFVLPEWIDQKAWDDFVGMRKEIKKPITENAKGLAVKALEKLALQGHNPDVVLNQSTFHSWQGLFAIKQENQNGFGQQANTGTNRPSRPSLVEQVRQRGAELQAERDGAARREASPATELWPAGMETPGIDWDGEFSCIDDADGSLVGADD